MNFFTWFFKNLFCSHSNLKHLRNIYGDETNALGGARSAWRCEDCKTVFYRGGLFP